MTKKVTDKDIRDLVNAYTQLPKKYREQAKVFLFYLQCVAFQGNPVGHDADVKKIPLSKVKALFASKQAAEASKKITEETIFEEIQKHRQEASR